MTDNVISLSEYLASRGTAKESEGVKQIFALENDSPDFALGFEAGQQWEVMKNFKRSNASKYVIIVKAPNVEQIQSMAATLKLCVRETISLENDSWSAIYIERP